jgi:NADPH2:quinone reductase
MRAVGHLQPTPDLSKSSFSEFTLRDPEPAPLDLRIRVEATGSNPVDYKERKTRTSKDGVTPVILGWDGAGVVEAVGDSVQGFEVGDKVFWSGEFTKAGSNAELQLVDHRIVGRMPQNLDFADAAALPLTGITAYEALFEQLQIPQRGAGDVLIIGGAGGVGSMGIQLLRTLTDARIYATAGREASREWVNQMGAHHVVEREQLAKGRADELPQFDYVFCTTHSDQYSKLFPEIIKPLGKLALIDDPDIFDVRPLKLKGLTTVWELIFTKTLLGHKVESQGTILNTLASLVEEGKMRSTASTILNGLNPNSLYEAHRLQESGTTIGKTIIAF